MIEIETLREVDRAYMGRVLCSRNKLIQDLLVILTERLYQEAMMMYSANIANDHKLWDEAKREVMTRNENQ